MLIDDSQYPIVIFNLHEEGNISMMLTFLRGVLERKRPFVLIADGSKGVNIALGAKERQLVAELFKAEREAMVRWCQGVVTVSTSPVLRGVITAVGWVSPLPVPGTVCASRAEAEAWARKQLNEAG